MCWIIVDKHVAFDCRLLVMGTAVKLSACPFGVDVWDIPVQRWTPFSIFILLGKRLNSGVHLFLCVILQNTWFSAKLTGL
jgi:hypothetical protein